MIRRLNIFCLILLAFAVSACATSTTTTQIQRARSYTPETTKADLNNAITFVPKGAYITNIDNSRDFALNTWVRAMPEASLWPRNDTPPCVLTARVVERNKSSARLEILAHADGMRPSYDLTALSYETARPQSTPASNASKPPTLPTYAITKRLLFAEHATETTAVLPQPGLNDIRGNELYAAIDLDHPNRRLGACIAALLNVSATTSESASLQAYAGKLPEHAAFVLLDAWTEPGFRVEIAFADELRQLAPQIQNEIATLFNNIPSAQYINITNSTIKNVSEALGAPQQDTLHVYITKHDNDYLIEDQGFRIALNPWTITDTSADTHKLALNAATRALFIAGDAVSAIYLLENELRRDASDAAFISVAPFLASLYHAIERDDWALELALEANARLSKVTTSSIKFSYNHVIASIASQIGRTAEFAPQLDIVRNRKSSSSNDNIFLFRTLALAALNDSQYAADASAMFHRLYDASKLTTFDEQLRCFALSQADDGACDDGISNAKTPFDKIFYNAVQQLRENASDDNTVLKTLTDLDEIGAPFLAQLFWLQLSKLAKSSEAAESLLLNAAAYAHRAQAHRDEIAIAALVQLSRANRGYNGRDNALASPIKRWQSLDFRAQLAALCYQTATQAAHSLDEKTKLLQYAYELYLSIGDAANAITCKDALP